MSAQHLLGIYVGCAVTCRYRTPKLSSTNSNDSQLRGVVEQALALTILEHTLLQVGLADENSKKPFWVWLDSIDFQRHVEWVTGEDVSRNENTLLDMLQVQHNTPFVSQQERPPWRLVVIENSELGSLEVILIYNHAVADGMSGRVFHHSLLKNLNLVTSGGSAIEMGHHVLRLSESIALTPPLENILQFPISSSFLASEGWKALRPPFLASYSSQLAEWAPVQPVGSQSRLQLIEIQGDTLSRILTVCRQRETTLTGLIHALALLSFATRLSDKQARAFVSGTPFELRRFMTQQKLLDHPESDAACLIGNFVAYFSYQFDSSIVADLRRRVLTRPSLGRNMLEDADNIIWSAARDFKEQLNKRLEIGTKDNTLGLTKFVSDWRKFFRDELKKPRTFSWEVSNLGVVDGSPAVDTVQNHDTDVWSIDKAIFSQSAAVAGPAYIFSPVTVRGGSLVITCTWQHEVVEETLATGVAQDLKLWLVEVSKGQYLSIGGKDPKA